MKKFLTHLPIEIYALAIPSILMLSGFLIWAINSEKQLSFVGVIGKLNYLVVLGGLELNSLFIFFWLLVAIYIVIYLINNLKKSAFRIPPVVPAIESLITINIFASVLSLMLGLSLMCLFNFVSGGRVLEFTMLIDKLERMIFGGLPAIPLINFLSGTPLESIILYSYFHLLLVFSLSVIIMAFLNKNIFRQALIAFFLAFLISIPFFTAVPIISPDGLYIAKVFKTDNINLPTLNFKESETFSSFNSFFHKVWISDDSSFYSVSSIPSMHAAWGLIALLGILKTKRKILSVIFSIWFIFNTVGAFYSLQHYTLDVVAGLILGFAAFYLAGKLMAWEARYYKGRDWYSFSDFLIKLTKYTRYAIIKRL